MKIGHWVVIALVVLGAWFAWQKWGKPAVSSAAA